MPDLGGFLRRAPRLIGGAMTKPEPLNFSRSDTGMPQGPNLLEQMLQGGLAAAASPNVTGGPADIFAAMGAGQQRVSDIKTERAKEFQQQRQQDVEDAQTQAKLMQVGRPVVGGMVEEDHAIPETPGAVAKVARKADPQRVVKYKTRDGKQIEVELYTPEEQMKKALEAKKAEAEMQAAIEVQARQKIAEAESAAKRSAAAKDLETFGVPVPEGLGLPAGTKVLPQNLDDIIRSMAELAKASGDPLKEMKFSEDKDGNVTAIPVFSSGKLGASQSLGPIGKGQARISQPSRAPSVNDEYMNEIGDSLAKGELTRLRDVVSLRSGGQYNPMALKIFSIARKLRREKYPDILKRKGEFSTGEIDRSVKLEDQFTTGLEGRNLQSFGIFLEHAGNAVDKLGPAMTNMTRSKFANRPISWWKQNMSGNADFQTFITALAPVRKEFEGFLLGNRALYEDDRKEGEKLLADNSSPKQFMAAMETMAHTAKARFTQMNYRYKRQLGHDLESPFSPEAVEAAKRLGVDLPGDATGDGGTVRMKAPDGTISDVQADQVAHYESLGAMRVQ